MYLMNLMNLIISMDLLINSAIQKFIEFNEFKLINEFNNLVNE